MPDEKRDVFLLVLIANLADVKARQEVSMRALARILETQSGRALNEVLAEMTVEWDAARKLHEAAMLQDLHDIASGLPWPPPLDGN